MSKCLLLSDGEGRLLALRQTLEVHGFTAVPDPADAELFCAREAGHGLFVLGAGEGCLIIDGVQELYGCEHTVMPDRIATVTYMAAAAVTSLKMEPGV